MLDVRPETPLVDAGFEVAERDLRRGGPLPAGALALRLLLVLLPLTLILVAGVAAQWVRARTPGAGILASGLLGLAVAGMWLAVELMLPRAEGAGWADLLPGAVLVGVASQALHGVTVFYFVGRVQRMNETYAPLGWPWSCCCGSTSWARLRSVRPC